MTSHSELDNTPEWALGGDDDDDDGDDYDYDDDDDDDDYDQSDYAAGWENGFAYAQETWLIWINRYRLMRTLTHWWQWRKAKLRWKMHDLRRWLRGEKTDNSEIPF